MQQRSLALETTQKVGEKVLLFGWVHARRNMGKVAFLDVRDRSGMVQVVIVPSELGDASSYLLRTFGGIRAQN